jgi:DNA polymerase-1
MPLINNKNFALKSFAERAAINAPLQSSNADIIKLAMISLDRIFKEKNYRTKVILQVHDELVFEAPENEVEIVTPIIRAEMQNVVQLKIPLIVDVKIGNNWGEMEKILIQ